MFLQEKKPHPPFSCKTENGKKGFFSLTRDRPREVDCRCLGVFCPFTRRHRKRTQKRRRRHTDRATRHFCSTKVAESPFSTLILTYKKILMFSFIYYLTKCTKEITAKWRFPHLCSRYVRRSGEVRKRERERERGKTLAKEQTRLSLLSLRPFPLPSAAASAARKG